MPLLILASTSPTRKNLLEQAGITFQAIAPTIDERQVEAQPLQEPVQTLALKLAEAKSKSLAASYPEAVIIGVDQTLILENKILHKPANLREAETQLRELRGKTHTLTSAICCSQGGKAIWHYEDHAHLTMRPFTDVFLQAYLNSVKDDILTSVGCYKLEGKGIQLFENIQGDYFTILGFPLLPLLKFLRSQGIITT